MPACRSRAWSSALMFSRSTGSSLPSWSLSYLVSISFSSARWLSTSGSC